MYRYAALFVAVVAAGLVLGTGTAQARGCHRVVTKKSVFTHVSVHNGVRCAGARHKLRKWSRRGFPHHMTGWYCDMHGRRKLCSYGNGNAPYFTFRRHRRAHAASRRARRGERRAIARAARRSRYTRAVRGKFNVTHVRISTVARYWGKALLEPKRRYRNQFGPAVAVVERRHHRWRVKTVGTADLGCVIHRRKVRRDLRLSCAGRTAR